MSGLVVGYDGSSCADAALGRALALGRRLEVPVYAVFGFDVNPLGGGEMGGYHDALRERATTVLARAQEQAAAAGVELHTVVAEEAPPRALIDLAHEHDAEAIIVGTRGESPLRGAILGSTPHKLLHLADVPVLVVPVPDERAG